MPDELPPRDGGRIAARGFQYQYLRTLESMLGCLDDPRVDAIRVEGDPTSAQETVDFDLLEADGSSLLAVQVKSKGHEGRATAPELFKTLCGLVTQQESRAHELWTNAVPDAGARRLVEILTAPTDLEDFRTQLQQLLARADRRLTELRRLTDPQLERLHAARVRFDDRDPFEVRAELRERLRRFRNEHRAGLGERSAGLLTGYLVAEILYRAADGRQATWPREEARQTLLVPDEVVAHAIGVRDWGVVVGPMPQVPDVPRLGCLADLRSAFTAGKQRTVRQAVLVGHSGIGKSSLAAGYIADRADDYDVIFWLDAESEPSLAASVRTALVHLRGPEFASAIGGDPKQLREQLRAELSRYPGRWVMVFDNPNRASDVAPWIPSTGAGDVLITTLDAATPARHGVVFEIGPMLQEEATELVQRRLAPSGPPVASDQLKLLADTVERWPLAIELLCGYLTSCGISTDNFEGFADTVRRRAMDDISSIPAGYPRTVVAAVKLCIAPFYEQWLAEPEDARVGRPIAFLMAIAMLASQRIPVHLLGAALMLDFATARKRNPEQGPLYLEMPALELHETLRSLRGYSLITFDESLPVFREGDPVELFGTVRVNTIIQEILRDHYDPVPDPVAILEGLSIHVNLWMVAALNSGLWQWVHLLFPHAVALLRNLAAYRVISESILLLIVNMGLVKRLSGEYEAAEETWRMCLGHMFAHDELRQDTLGIQVFTSLAELRLSRPDRCSATLEELQRWLEFLLITLQQLALEAPEITSHLLATLMVTLRLPQSQPILASQAGLQRIVVALDDLTLRVPAAPLAAISKDLTDIERQLSSPDINATDAERQCRVLLADSELAAINAVGLRRILIEVLVRDDRWAEAQVELGKVLAVPGAAPLQVDATIQLIQNVGLYCAGKVLLTEDAAKPIAVAMFTDLLDWPQTGLVMMQARRPDQRRHELLLAVQELLAGRVVAAEQVLNGIAVTEIDEHAEDVEGGTGWRMLWQHARLRVFREAWMPPSVR
ncbi:hypothetical protein [Glycomyces sp. MUSA5-2]|uniref:hypothetical protein n=1 Tax=Glycomyces sp. MUSA5-2 TaxID=2053002 RepID=UPI00300A4EA3